ncbi:G5 domain-containing protein [Micromonospora sp. WMMD1128]|uniref:G5 domain-containing protein n=1 Tax=Micromonospora sp. WMMD1128 TaxID=3015150 RepID=UPI00248AA53D|nr:G5 domain-containing protein [Micromonospora sp. WMMD1128]WBB72937.1 G5 domain-containing protein [Micromonospora sp. WMMD1128]
MTHPSPQNPATVPVGAGRAHPAPKQSRRRRLSGGAKVAVVSTGLLLLAGCGGVATGASADAPKQPDKTEAAPATTGVGATAPAVVDLATSAPSPTEASPSPSASPLVRITTVTSTAKIAYSTRTVKDGTLSRGTKKVRTRGVAGVRTLTYRVTVTDGVQTGKKLVRSVVTRKPITQVVAVGTKQTRSCDPNYSGACVPIASDVDCAGGSGNGPAYVTGPVRVVGSDIYDLDRDGDGIGCDD